MTEDSQVILDRFRFAFKPDPVLSIADWADAYRELAPEASREHGRYRTRRTPYARGVMDALSPSSPWHDIVAMKPTQVGFTEIGNNAVGFYMDQAPVPILIVQPTLPDAKNESRMRIGPMIENTPRLKARMKSEGSRKAGNTMLEKEFIGGVLRLTGANSDKGLRRTPIGFLFCDEIDSYPADVAKQGDPMKLAEKRTTTFPNAKRFKISTPTVEGISRIEREFNQSTMDRFHVPCPECGTLQALWWKNLEWARDPDGYLIRDTVRYVCESCGFGIDEELHKQAMLEAGVWVSQFPNRKIKGFHLNGLYSPWSSWADLIEEWHQAQQDKALLKVFVNTVLAEVYIEDPARKDEHYLMAEGRREDYGTTVPAGACVLTAGVDVQRDRLEVEVVAWGPGMESWSMDWVQFTGNTAGNEPWESLLEYLNTPWAHASGHQLRIACTCIDSGDQTARVYEFVRGRSQMRIFATKGLSTPGKPLSSTPTRTNIARVPLFPIGVDTAKDDIYNRLAIEEPGPGYCHFPTRYGLEYFRQLTSERMYRHKKGLGEVRKYVLIKGRRNEVLDCRVNAYAAVDILRPSWVLLAARLRVPAAGSPGNATAKDTTAERLKSERPLSMAQYKADPIERPARVRPKRRIGLRSVGSF